MKALTQQSRQNDPQLWLVVAAFLAIYFIWGSTYLGIRIAIETIPPLLMAGVRFLLAGSALFLWTRWRGLPMPDRIHWRSAFLIGGLMLVGGNGGVTWSEQYIPSGLAAVLVATVPLWIVVFEWLRPGGNFPGKQVLFGLFLGFGGVIVLIGPANLNGNSDINLIGVGVILLATVAWASGSLYSREAPLPSSQIVGISIEMLCGGLMLLGLGLLTGEGSEITWQAISTRSLLALIYLTIFGSMVAFTAYIWLLKTVSPARAATYAYVNPVIAVFLGWTLGDEALTTTMLIASAMIIGAVILITSYRQRRLASHQDKFDGSNVITETQDGELHETDNPNERDFSHQNVGTLAQDQC